MTHNDFSLDYNTLGRIEGLVEAWGMENWTPAQEARIYELYGLLSTRFVVHIYNKGLKSSQTTLARIEEMLTVDI